ncbi:hypothetical protein HG263_05310 [Pseudoalteromonas sp. JBTF-M23]|uniref:YdaS antitoxin of YdaST toxin-antitoxin system n=1 Tax=Pseudoalteromonas caenipelagi TaxID=2726988 RepID=A0A849VAI4_9GAMM|nr:hypothetical protein [Pseudoalteromonas caenipelagi]NOU49955.1 hypothetical protein [Pseudoalteromonas caenipelagi]
MIILEICPPSKKLYNTVRAAYAFKGDSLNKACEKIGVAPQNARQALHGAWAGEKAKQCVDQILEDCGLNSQGV